MVRQRCALLSPTSRPLCAIASRYTVQCPCRLIRLVPASVRRVALLWVGPSADLAEHSGVSEPIIARLKSAEGKLEGREQPHIHRRERRRAGPPVTKKIEEERLRKAARDSLCASRQEASSSSNKNGGDGLPKKHPGCAARGPEHDRSHCQHKSRGALHPRVP